MTPSLLDRSPLVALVADKNIELALNGLLSRHSSLGIRRVEAEIYVHPERDPGCLLRGHDFLRPFSTQYEYALLMLDRQGCGRENETRSALEEMTEQHLARAGWGSRAVAIVLDPELEVWVWAGSPHVERVLGWHGRSPTLRTWLEEVGMMSDQRGKPIHPKRAVEEALRIVGKPRSSALYGDLARSVTLESCTDPSFLKLRATLGEWFPQVPREAT